MQNVVYLCHRMKARKQHLLIFMLMCTTRQLFHPTGEKNASIRYIIFLLVILENTNQLCISVCVNPQISCFDSSSSGGIGPHYYF